MEPSIRPQQRGTIHWLSQGNACSRNAKTFQVEGFGSTTLRRQDIARGFEPDACFYIENLVRVKGKTELDLQIDPPPDLVIEIDITRSSIDKFAILAHVGVSEVGAMMADGWLFFGCMGQHTLSTKQVAYFEASPLQT